MAAEGVEAVERALSILRAFGEGDEALALAELARRTGLYKSTILRLAASLARQRFLARGDDGLYRLGPELWRLGALYRRRLDLGGIVRPELRRLVEATGETASFYVRDGDERLCLYRENSPRAVRHHLEEGARLPLDRGAAGRVLLAYSGARGAAFEGIRRAGGYVSLGERDPDIGAAAVPVFDAAGGLAGALAVSGLLSRFDERARAAALAALHRAADALAALIPAREDAPAGPSRRPVRRRGC
jgi:DNA-binding IclR family transcriptional regulator